MRKFFFSVIVKKETMNIRYYLRNINKECKMGIENYFASKKLPQVARLLKKEEQQIKQIVVTGEYFQKHNAFSVQIDIPLGKNLYSAQEQSHNVLKAIDFSVQRIIKQIKSKQKH